MHKKEHTAGVSHKKLAMVSNLMSVRSQKYRPPATINQRRNPAVIPATLNFPPSESEVLINKGDDTNLSVSLSLSPPYSLAIANKQE